MNSITQNNSFRIKIWQAPLRLFVCTDRMLHCSVPRFVDWTFVFPSRARLFFQWLWASFLRISFVESFTAELDFFCFLVEAAIGFTNLRQIISEQWNSSLKNPGSRLACRIWYVRCNTFQGKSYRRSWLKNCFCSPVSWYSSELLSFRALNVVTELGGEKRCPILSLRMNWSHKTYQKRYNIIQLWAA